jgi:hypothetical protein
MAFAMNYLAGACSFNLRPKAGAKPISGDAKRLSGIGAARLGRILVHLGVAEMHEN